MINDYMHYFISILLNSGIKQVHETDLIKQFDEFAGWLHDGHDLNELKQELIGLCSENNIQVIVS